VQTYSDFFPSLQAKYTLDDETQFRLAYSTAIARPGFNQITAAKSFDLSNYPDILISEGNPSLKPTYGDSFDLTAEHYMPDGAIATAGLFYKYFTNYIIPTVSTVNNSNGGQTITSSFSNIGDAFAEGIEANYIQQLTMLPDPYNGLGFDGNVTYNYTRGDIRPGDRTILPQTSQLNYNLEFFYEKGPIGVRIAESYVGWNIFAVGSDPTQDQWSTPRFRLDLGATYDITDQMQLYFDAKNLTNTLLEFTQTKSTYYPIQREFYGPTYFLGIRVRLGEDGGGETHFGGSDDD
jgi:TonB-dependent receptor